MHNQSYNSENRTTTGNNKLFILIGFIVATLVAYFIFSGPTEEEMEAIRDARRNAEEKIEEHAIAVEHWYQTRKEYCEETAKNLVGLKAKWKLVFGSKEEYQKFVSSKIQEILLPPEEVKNSFLLETKYFLKDLQDIEYTLGEVTDCTELKETHNNRTPIIHSHQTDNTFGDETVADIRNTLISYIGGEIATAITTRLAVSTGILTTASLSAPKTLGIGLVAGIIVDQIISLFSDPEAEVIVQLKLMLDQTGKKQADVYRAEMNKILDTFEEKWIDSF